MNQDTFRTTLAWHEALDLAPHLVRIAEQLPESEMSGLAAQLRALAVDVPASIASDLAVSSQAAHVVCLRAVAALEVIERVYPALDTAAAREAADSLLGRVATGNIAEQQARPAGPVDNDDDEGEISAPVSETVSAPVIESASPAPTTSVQVQPVAPSPTSVPVMGAPAPTPVSTEATDVHPDSPQ